jgi:hypothetical protein
MRCSRRAGIVSRRLLTYALADMAKYSNLAVTSRGRFQRPPLASKASGSRPLTFGRIFFDSSSLVKLYRHEIGTPAVDRLANSGRKAVRISRLTVAELISAFCDRA